MRPLSRKQILANLGPDGATLGDRLYILEEVDSTNLWLRRQVDAGHIKSGTVCIAESQTDGRGRDSRSWLATPYSNIMLSVAWRFDVGLSTVTGLSLAAGVAVVRTLRDQGIHDVGLKWPNDLVWKEKKLAGMLVGIVHEACGTTLAIVGVGVNVEIGQKAADQIDQPWTDLTRIGYAEVNRNELVARLVTHLYEVFRTFESQGFQPFKEEWERLHVYADRRVCVRHGVESFSGHVMGIDADGALRVKDEQGDVRAFYCGDISLRPES